MSSGSLGFRMINVLYISNVEQLGQPQQILPGIHKRPLPDSGVPELLQTKAEQRFAQRAVRVYLSTTRPRQ